MVRNQLSTRAPLQQTCRTWHCWGLFLQEHVLWSCNTCWNSLAPSGCSTGSGPIPLPLSCGSRILQQPLRLTPSLSPKISALSQPLVSSHLYLHIPGMWVPSRSTRTFSCWTGVSFQQYLPLQDLCHLLSNISCSPGSDAHSSWALLKDTARPAGNCYSPRGNQGRPRPQQVEFIFLTH